MPRITYTLSNRQRKELLERGSRLYIVMPGDVPRLDDVEMMQWTREAFGDLGQYVRTIDEQIVRAIIRPRQTEPTLTGILGEITDREVRGASDGIAVVYETIIATLAIARHRHDSGREQWPSDMTIDGVSVLD